MFSPLYKYGEMKRKKKTERPTTVSLTNTSAGILHSIAILPCNRESWNRPKVLVFQYYAFWMLLKITVSHHKF